MAARKARIAAVIFDCDGVLVDSEILAVEVEMAMLAGAGLLYDVSEFKARFMGMSDRAFYEALNQDSIARRGHPLPENFSRDCQARLQSEVRARIAEVRGARAAIAPLTQAKAVASSSTAEKLEIKLRQTRLWELFAPHIYSADHVARAKPEPDLFLFSAKSLGVAPADCLVLEDSINGIKAAVAAGMRAWAFCGGGHIDETTPKRLKDAGAERVVASWPDAARLFAAL